MFCLVICVQQLPSASQHWKPASLSAGVLKRDSKGSDAATLSRAEEADVEMVAVRQMLCFLGFVGILKICRTFC